MQLHQIKAEIPAAAADATNDLLLELGIGGWSLLEDAIAKRAWVVGIFTDAAEARESWTALKPMLPAEPIGEVEFAPLGDQDWRDSYKAHFKAWQFGRLHWVPEWERATFQLPEGDAVLWLDPGLAFGTGNHETTRLVVERLVGRLEEGGERREAGGERREEGGGGLDKVRVIDAGCGSGILALSAAKLGCTDIEAFDNDPEAVRVSEENAALNGLAGRVRFFTGDLVSGLAGRQADVLLANIQADVLMRFAPQLLGAVASGGTLVLSGILAHELDQVRNVFSAAAPGWTVDSRVMSEWSDLELVRPS